MYPGRSKQGSHKNQFSNIIHFLANDFTIVHGNVYIIIKIVCLPTNISIVKDLSTGKKLV